jgi:hypothetical protein
MHHRCLEKIGTLQRGDRIHIQGCIPAGDRQWEGTIVVKVCEDHDRPFHLIGSAHVPTQLLSTSSSRLMWLYACGKTTQPNMVWELIQKRGSIWQWKIGRIQKLRKEAGKDLGVGIPWASWGQYNISNFLVQISLFQWIWFGSFILLINLVCSVWSSPVCSPFVTFCPLHHLEEEKKM